MRRSTFFAAAHHLIATFRASGLEDLLLAIRLTGGHLDEDTAALRVFQAYTLARAGFQATEVMLMDAFDLATIDDPAFWHALTSAGSEDRLHSATEVLNAWNKLLDVHPRLQRLLDVDGTLLQANAEGLTASTRSLVMVLIKDGPELPLTPSRIAAVLESLDRLVDSASQILGFDDRELKVVYMDMGSTIEVWIKAAENIVRFLRDTFATVTSRLMLREELQADKRIDLVAKSIPVILEIRDNAKRLGPAQAELLEMTITSSLVKFIAQGATLHEVTRDYPADYPAAYRTLTSPTKLLPPAKAGVPDERETKGNTK